MMYPTTTSVQCEKDSREGRPLKFTAFVESPDSVETVTKFYQTQPQSAGWTVDPTDVQSSTHSVVSIKKDKGYASIVINPGEKGTGSSLQIHAYPNGNENN